MIQDLQLHRFYDASENTFASVVYLRMTDSKGKVHVSLVLAKTKVAPIKRLTILRLELWEHIYWPRFSIIQKKFIQISTIWSESQRGWFILSIIVKRRVPLQIVCQSGIETCQKLLDEVFTKECFEVELKRIAKGKQLPHKSIFHLLNPFIGPNGLLHLGRHQDDYRLTYAGGYPVILQGKHQLIQLIICHKHLRLLHAGPTLLTASLNHRFYIMGVRRYVPSITCDCIVCHWEAIKPQLQKTGKLPTERITPTHPDTVFATVGVYYNGPVKIKYGPIRKPTILKAYICVFILMSVKAVHIEAVSDLTTEAFLACIRW